MSTLDELAKQAAIDVQGERTTFAEEVATIKRVAVAYARERVAACFEVKDLAPEYREIRGRHATQACSQIRCAHEWHEDINVQPGEPLNYATHAEAETALYALVLAIVPDEVPRG